MCTKKRTGIIYFITFASVLQMNILKPAFMKTTSIMIILMIATFTMSAFASEKNSKTLTELRASQSYKHINIVGEMDVQLVSNSNPGISVEGTEAQIRNTITMLKGDTLFIYLVQPAGTKDKVFVKLNIGEIQTLSADGKMKVTSDGEIDTPPFTIKRSGGADVKIKFKELKDQQKVTG